MGELEREKKYGKSVPVITESFASKAMVPGDTWKVYLKASDPDGDMNSIAAVVFQPGQGQYQVSYTRVNNENAKEMNGFIYLNTLIPGGYDFLNFETLTLTVQIKDKAGHYSKPVEFPLYFDPRATTQEPPPDGVFKEEGLGPIMTILHPIGGYSSGGFGS